MHHCSTLAGSQWKYFCITGLRALSKRSLYCTHIDLQCLGRCKGKNWICKTYKINPERYVKVACLEIFFGSSIGHLLNKLVIKRLLILESSHHILVFPGLETFCLSDNWYQWGDLTKTDTEKNNDIDIDIKIAQLKMRHFGDLFSLV